MMKCFYGLNNCFFMVVLPEGDQKVISAPSVKLRAVG